MKRRAIVSVLALALATMVPTFRISEARAQTDLAPLCFGDCDMNGRVQVSDLVMLVNIALGSAPTSACPGVTGPPGIDDLLGAVNTVLTHCPIPITYRLTDASTITVSQGPGFPAPIPQPLTGEFTVTVCTHPPPNTLIGLTIKRIDFGAEGITVSEGDPVQDGCSGPSDFGYGGISADTINPPPVTVMSAVLAVNGQSREFFGTGPYEGNPNLPPYDGTSPPPPFNDLAVCTVQICDNIRSGAQPGYLLTLFVVPKDR